MDAIPSNQALGPGPTNSGQNLHTNTNSDTTITNNNINNSPQQQYHLYTNGVGSASPNARLVLTNVRQTSVTSSPNMSQSTTTAPTIATSVGLASCSALPPQIPCLTTTPKKSMYVRALFDYNPNTDSGLPSRGLPFQHGDILHVVNASDREWWQARRLIAPDSDDNAMNTLSLCKSMANTQLTSGPTSTANTTTTTLCSSSLGIIPSRQRLERRQRIRSKHVNFLGNVTVIGSAASAAAAAANSSNAFANASDFAEYMNGDAADLADPMSVIPDHSVTTYSSNSLPMPGTASAVAPNQTETMPTTTTTTDGRIEPDKKKRSNSLSRIFFKRFCYRSNKPNSTGPVSITRTGSLDAVNENRTEAVRSYDVVVPITITFARPVVLFGPLKERVMDELLQDRKYATCVPHTNRPPNAGEIDGVDYHFVGSKSTMEADIKAGRFVDVGQFQDYYYATSIDSIRRTVQSGRICLLDLNIDAARQLENADLFPITILLKPESVARLRSIQRRLTEDQAKRSMELAERLENENWRFLSTIITYDSIEHAVQSVQQFVQVHNGPLIWITPHLARSRLNGKDLTMVGPAASATLPRSPQQLMNQSIASSNSNSNHTLTTSNRNSPRTVTTK